MRPVWAFLYLAAEAECEVVRARRQTNRIRALVGGSLALLVGVIIFVIIRT